MAADAARAAPPPKTTRHYLLAVAGGGIISFGIHPFANCGGEFERVPNGVDNLKNWIAVAGAGKIIWNSVEAVPIFSGPAPTLAPGARRA